MRAKGLTVDMEGFEAAMDRQRTMARESWSGSGQAHQGAVWLALRERLGPSVFTGHEETETTAEVLALVMDGAPVESAKAGMRVWALFDRTPFYAESGGQAGDHGEASWPGGRSCEPPRPCAAVYAPASLTSWPS